MNNNLLREILFRGKRLDNSKWVYGSFAFIAQDDRPAIRARNDEWHGWVAVEPETVGQFTGLHDKDGKRIFEGDLVKAERIVNGDEWFGVVVWWNGCFAIQGGKYRNVPAIDLFRGYEVIGNIHDNPELLEVG